MVDVMKLLIQSGFEPDSASKEWHERMDRFAALLLEEAAKICECEVKTWSHPGSITRHECAQHIRAAKPTEKA